MNCRELEGNELPEELRRALAARPSPETRWEVILCASRRGMTREERAESREQRADDSKVEDRKLHGWAQ
jgi:hypothetical protein